MLPAEQVAVMIGETLKNSSIPIIQHPQLNFLITALFINWGFFISIFQAAVIIIYFYSLKGITII